MSDQAQTDETDPFSFTGDDNLVALALEAEPRFPTDFKQLIAPLQLLRSYVDDEEHQQRFTVFTNGSQICGGSLLDKRELDQDRTMLWNEVVATFGEMYPIDDPVSALAVAEDVRRWMRAAHEKGYEILDHDQSWDGYSVKQITGCVQLWRFLSGEISSRLVSEEDLPQIRF